MITTPLNARLNAPRRVFAGFAVYSFAMGNIFPRLGAIQSQMGVGEGAFGLGLIGAPLGTLIALSFAAPIIEKLGFRRTLLSCIPLLALLYAIAVHAPTPMWLFVMLLPIGLLLGVIEVILNTEADRVEAQAGYRIMNRAHAFWSLGFFAAGLCGAAMAGLGVSPQLHLALVVPVVAVFVWLFLGDYRPAPNRTRRSGIPEERSPLFSTPSGPILVLVGVTLSAMLMEGASMDWSAIYLRDTFAATPFAMGFGVVTFALSQGVARFFADAFVERYSPVLVARVLIVTLLVGCLLVAFAPGIGWSLLGFALMGTGSSVLFPLAMSAAAQREDRPAAVNVASLAQISFVIFLVGPPILGIVAEHYGIRAAFGLGLPLIVLSLLTAGSLGRKAQD